VWGQTGNSANVTVIAADGADHVVVSGAPGLADRLVDFAPTLVLDALGGGYTDEVVAAMANGGRLVVYGTSDNEIVTVNMRRLYRKAISVHGLSAFVTAPAGDQAILDALFAMLANGTLRIRISDVLNLADAAEAHSRIVERRAHGKLLLDTRR
jgi:NADPH:quinone reductase